MNRYPPCRTIHLVSLYIQSPILSVQSFDHMWATKLNLACLLMDRSVQNHDNNRTSSTLVQPYL